jgi:hypothetical protein
MSDSRDQMIAALREIILPVLRDMGFKGSFPHFRRIRDTQIDLLTFQFSHYGGSFVVEVAHCEPGGFTTPWGKHIPPKQVRAHDINQRLRLGSNPPKQQDHWFHFEPERPGICTDAASLLLPLLHSQAEEYWRTHSKLSDERSR